MDWDFTQSLTVTTGKSAPYSWPVSGFSDKGPVLPSQPPVVQTDNEKAFGIDGFAGTDHIVPPAGVFILRTVLAGNVMIA